MFLLFRAHASGDYGDTLDCDYALVAVDVDELSERYQTFMRLRHMDDLSDLTEMIFFGNAEFFRESEVEKFVETCPDTDPIVIDEYPKDAKSERTECDEMHVTLGGFYWACFPKHTEVQVNTMPISVESLQELAED